MQIIGRGEDELDEWGHSDDSSDSEFGSLLDEHEEDIHRDANYARYHELDRLEKVQKYLNYMASMLVLVFLGYSSASFFHRYFSAIGTDSSFSASPLVGLNLDTSFEELRRPTPYSDSDDSQEIKRISILGERNSGSIELAHALSQCFPHAEVTTSLSRNGYWFQSEDLKIPMAQTLVIGVFLNAYDWVDLMMQNPLHAPMHSGLSWERFATKPWTINRLNNDFKLKNKRGNYCQHDFNYREVIPCKVRSSEEKYPVYEMIPDGTNDDDSEFFENILELRSSKIKNFVSTMYWENVTHFIGVKLEDLRNLGMDVLIQSIELRTGMLSFCIEPPAVTEEDYLSLLFQLRLDLNYTKWMSEHVDWNTERLIGYRMGERTHDAPELDVSEEEKEEIMPYINGEASYSVYKPPISSTIGPKIAWLLSFPSSGASLTLELIKYVTNTTTATNDGSEYVDSNGFSVPLYSDVEGPFIWGEPFRVPSTYVLTKAYCGGYCRDCPPIDYIETAETFMQKCLQVTPVGKKSIRYEENLIKKIVHVVRNPFDNIEARFYYAYKSWMGDRDKKKDGQFPFSLDKEGFHDWCKYHDSHWQENENILYSPKLLSLSKDVPCHADFYRYVQWHNLVITVSLSKLKIPSLKIYYEDYRTDKLETSVKDILKYLDIPSVGNVLSLNREKRHAHFNEKQMNATILYIKELASVETNYLLKRYFPDTDF